MVAVSEFTKILVETLRISVLITSFVFTMMMLVEFINIVTKGIVAKWLSKGNVGGFFLVALIATTPGCLGGFTAVALFIHGVISRGMLVGGMIASSGDEAFFMLAMMPKESLLLFGFLLFYGILVGIMVDKVSGKKCFLGRDCIHSIEIPEEEKEHFRRKDFKSWSFLRNVFLLGYISMFILVIYGIIGEEEWNWERFALLFSSIVGFFVVLISSDHFLDEHIFHHIVKKHIGKLLLWTLSALIIMEFIKIQSSQIELLVKKNELIAIVIASLIGVLPESGPHLIFVIGFVNGIFPFSTLVASSVVQDGHGMLPLLAESKTEFLKVKTINFFAGILAGIFFMLLKF